MLILALDSFLPTKPHRYEMSYRSSFVFSLLMILLSCSCYLHVYPAVVLFCMQPELYRLLSRQAKTLRKILVFGGMLVGCLIEQQRAVVM